jgi:hypothetical protein
MCKISFVRVRTNVAELQKSADLLIPCLWYNSGLHS